MILVDAGPLVAVLHRDDDHHEECVDALKSVREPLGTVWPVIAEAMDLRGLSWDAQDALWDMLAGGPMRLIPLTVDDVPRMRALMRKYRDLPMDLADAALVRVAEREGIGRVFTLARRDFSLYRPARIGRFAIVP